MVYEGKPSRGCAVCRRRRIKCDEALPSCSYCVKTKTVCPGYKSQFDVAWRDQNAVAEKSVRRRKNVMDKADRERAISVQKSNLPSVTLSQDFEGYAVDFFLSTYIAPRKDPEVQHYFLDYLGPVWYQAPPNSPLRFAVTAVASSLLVAWSKFRLKEALCFSYPQYLRAIASVRQSLQGSGRVTDDVLMAILVLEMYENMQSFMTTKSNASPHVSGAAALIAQRKRLPIANELSRKIILGARNHIIGKALENSEFVSPSISKLEDLTRSVPKTACIRLDDLLCEVANVQAWASRLCSTTEAQGFDNVLNMLKEAMELDRRLLSWTASVPDSWRVVRVYAANCIPENVRDAGMYQGYCDVYSNIFIAINFNIYYTSRIKLQQSILTCLEYLSPEKWDIACKTALDIIQDLADSVCASVPYFLGDRTTIRRLDEPGAQYPHAVGLSMPSDHPVAAAAYAGRFLIPRLKDIMSPNLRLREGQRQWVGGQMHRIMKIYAINAS